MDPQDKTEDTTASMGLATTHGPGRRTVVGFLDLSAEIRCRIYELALTCDTQMKEPPKDYDDDASSELELLNLTLCYFDHKLCTTIFQTNRQIYNEAMAVFLKQNLLVRIVTQDSEVRRLMRVYGVPIFAINQVAKECKWAALDVILSKRPYDAEKEIYLVLACHLPLITDHLIDIGPGIFHGRLQLNEIARQLPLLQHETQDLTVFRSWLLSNIPFLEHWTPLVEGGAVALRGHSEKFTPRARLLHWLHHVEVKAGEAEHALHACEARITMRHLFIASTYLHDIYAVQMYDAPTLGDFLENEVLATRLTSSRHNIHWKMASLSLSMAQENQSNPSIAAELITQMQLSAAEARLAVDQMEWSTFYPSSEQREKLKDWAVQVAILYKQLGIDPEEHRYLYLQRLRR